jgi:hypothetical protein
MIRSTRWRRRAAPVAEKWLQKLGVMLGARSAVMYDADTAHRAQVAKAEEQAKLAAHKRRREFDAQLAARRAVEAEDAA